MQRKNLTQAVRIAFLVTPGMLTTGTALAYEMWKAAADCEKAGRTGKTAELQMVAVEHEEKNQGGVSLRSENLIDGETFFDVIYIPALWRNPRLIVERIGAPLSSWLRMQYGQSAHIAAASSGVSLVAESGLLDGRAATTHWSNFARFEKDYPDVRLKKEFFITQTGTLYCAASINSLADVTVYLIERFFDRSTAHQVERNFSHEIRRTYAEYRYLDGQTSSFHDEFVLEAQIWIREHLASSVSVADLANRLGFSRRTLERRFKDSTGFSVKAWWQERRIIFGKELLEKTDLTIGEIAWRVGYSDPGYFSSLFGRIIGVSPSEYRETVRKKLFRQEEV
jgi:transcriptional regulator GlxA family with amidase domain